MKKASKKVVIGLAIAIILLFLSAFAFYNAGSWLKGNDRPVPSHAIIILAGPPTRSFYAADLYLQGLAKEVYVSRPIREYPLKMLDDLGVYVPKAEDLYKEVLIKKGVPPQNIHFLGDACVNTIEEAEAANRVFHGENCKVLIVTSPFHVKRTQMVFKKIVQNCDFQVLATPYEPFPKKWWTDQDSARNVILEVIKIVFYQIGGRFKSPEKKSQRHSLYCPATTSLSA